MRTAIVVSCALALSACATVKNNYVPETTQISVPPLNEERTASLGEELMRQGTATTTKGVRLDQRNNIRGYTLTQGFYPQTGEDEEYVFTSFGIGTTMAGMGRINLGGSLLGPVTYPRGIRFDKTKQQTCVIVPNAYGITQPLCDTEYGYRFTEQPMISENNFQQTLIYSGRVGDRIRVSYREFSGSMARPAFSNEAEYDLSQSDTIAYRGARIKVIEADNESIRYVVLTNFNTN
tara:strand:+ start:82 stop:786 length:705 start_codon:yes stop_codon:yes gene_type:complete